MPRFFKKGKKVVRKGGRRRLQPGMDFVPLQPAKNIARLGLKSVKGIGKRVASAWRGGRKRVTKAFAQRPNFLTIELHQR